MSLAYVPLLIEAPVSQVRLPCYFGSLFKFLFSMLRAFLVLSCLSRLLRLQTHGPLLTAGGDSGRSAMDVETPVIHT